MTLLILSFCIASGLVMFAGDRMAGVADRIAIATGLSHGFIGFLLLSAATSLPELVTSLSATVWLGAAGLAFGNVFGSNMCNVTIVFLMDLFYEKGRVLRYMKLEDLSPAIWGVLMTCLAVGGVVLGILEDDRFFIGRLNIVSIPLLVVYGFALKFAFADEADEVDEGPDRLPFDSEEGEAPVRESIQKLALKFGGYCLVTLVAGCWLTRICDQIATRTILGETFVGVLLLAWVTSLPEVTVTLAAVRRGHLDMGLANIVGSGIFNLAILGVCDVFSWRGSPFLLEGARDSLPAALCSLAMTALIMMGILDSRWKDRGIGRVSLASIWIMILYVLGTYLTYAVGH